MSYTNEELLQEFITTRGLSKSTYYSFRNALRHYCNFQEKTLQELLDEAEEEEEQKIKEKENLKKDKAWRFLWNDYNTKLILDETLMTNAVELLGKDKEELEEILDWVLLTEIKVDTNYWEDVLRKYNENKDEF